MTSAIVLPAGRRSAPQRSRPAKPPAQSLRQRLLSLRQAYGRAAMLDLHR
jgi:hypothetical protein